MLIDSNLYQIRQKNIIFIMDKHSSLSQINSMLSSQKSQSNSANSSFQSNVLSPRNSQLSNSSKIIQSLPPRPPTNYRNQANQILICYNQGEPKTIHLPAYLSVKINNIESITIEQNVANVNLSLMFTVYFGRFNEKFVDEVCYKMKMGFSRDEEIQLKKTSEQRQDEENKKNEEIFDEDSDDQEEEQQEARVEEKPYKKGEKSFIIRKTFQANLTAYSFLTPFQIHDLIVGIELRKIQITLGGETIEVKLNLMNVDYRDIKNRFKCVNFSQMSNYAQYNLAEYLLTFENTLQRPKKLLGDFFKPKLLFELLALGKNLKKQQKKGKQVKKTKKSESIQNNQQNKKQNKQKKKENSQPVIQIPKLPKPQQDQSYKKGEFTQQQALQYCLKKYNNKHYECALFLLDNKNVQYCNFHLPIYKKPLTNFLTLYLPIWVLSFITLCLFFLRNDYGSRVSAVAALTLAFIPIVETVKSQTPRVSNITFVEVVVILQIVASFLFLVQSYWVKQEGEGYLFQPGNNFLFALAVIITIWNIIIPIVFLGLFLFIGESWLNRDPNYIDFKFKRDEWNYNQQADIFFKAKKAALNSLQFMKKAETGQIKKQEQCKNKGLKKPKKYNNKLKKILTQNQKDFEKMEQFDNEINRINGYAHLIRRGTSLGEIRD